MWRTQARVRGAEWQYDCGVDYVDVIAISKHSGYTFFICLDHTRQNIRYALVEQRSGAVWSYVDTPEEAIASIGNFVCNQSYSAKNKDYARYYIEDNQKFHAPDLNPEGGIVSFDWRWGQEHKFLFGNYKKLPKVRVIEELGLAYPKDHYVHLSVTKTEADFVAYTPSESYGEQDRQVRMKYGKYLRKAFPDLSDATIQRAVNEFRAALHLESLPATLHFTTDKDKITEIFETPMYACGSSSYSCMFNKFDDWDRHTRPYHVYADSPDVAVAYMTEKGEIVARSVVSTKDKTWIRLYSTMSYSATVCTAMEGLLNGIGYVRGDIHGNRLSIVGNETNNNPIAPYIDHGDVGIKLTSDRKYWLAVGKSEAIFDCSRTEGYAESQEPCCSTCNIPEDECECSYCECCEERYAEGCDSCHFCENCDDCEEHGGCDCERCENCRNVLNGRRRYVVVCECERCTNCNDLMDDCECERCDDCCGLTDDCECEEGEKECYRTQTC